MNYTFFMPKIETRSVENKGIREFIVKGYATVPNHIYNYKNELNQNPVRSFKEYFTERAVENIKRKAQNQNIFIDIGHQIATKLNVEKVFDDLQKKTGQNLTEEKEYVINRIKGTDIPMFKLNDLQIDNRGLFVELRGNPFYRSIDPEHQTYFDAVWNSLENGFINGMSLNFKPTSFNQINNELRQIDDADVYGITLASGVANDMANITEVAMRCVENVRGEAKCQMRRMIL